MRSMGAGMALSPGRQKIAWQIYLYGLLLALLLAPPAAAKDVVGWVEKVRLQPGNVLLKAKMDTGAKSSSLNCDCQQVFERDGDEWVRFSLTDINGQAVRLERKVERYVNIKRHFNELEERPVIRMGICLGSVYREIEVNLIDRSGLNYPLLIGRDFLKPTFVVDPEAKFTRQPSCVVSEHVVPGQNE
jgi:hypothetical protein